MNIGEPLLDAIAIIAAMGLTSLTGVMLPSISYQVAGLHRGSSPATPLVILTLLILGLLERAGAYRPTRSLLHIRETAALLTVASTITGVLLALWPLQIRPVSMAEIPVFGCILFALLLLEKTCMHSLCQTLHKRGITPSPIVIIGAGLACRRIYSACVNSPRLGMWPVMVINPLGTTSREESVAESSYSVKQSAVVRVEQVDCQKLTAAGIEKLLLMANNFDRDQTQEILRRATASGLESEVCLGDDAAADAPVELADIDGVMLWRPFSADFRQVSQLAKRAFDIIVATALLVLLGPAMLFIAAAIKLTSPGPVLFRQVRAARQGRGFSMLKFRSMHTESCGDRLSPTSGADSRISAVGRILRKASLDELPQLLNVLAGDMSLVGPRPEMPFLVKDYTPLQFRRLEVTPGITGLWQISGHRRHLIHDNMQYDLYYVRHQNFFLDLAILIHTAVFAMKGI